MTTFFDKRGRPIVPTAGMEDQLTQISSAIEADYHGCGFHSLTRFGKSTLAEFICAFHAWIRTKYLAKQLDVRTIGGGESAIFDWFLNQIGIRSVARQGADAKLERIANTIHLQLQAADSNLFLAIFDDANLLDADAYQHIVTIDKALYSRGIRLFAVFLFQDNHTSGRTEKINRLIVPPQVRSRYLTRYHRMHGIRGPEDLYIFLQRFEDQVYMESGADVSLPRHLCPSLYENGFRLCNSSEQIWEQGRILKVAAGRLLHDEWPMKATSLIAYFLATRVICSIGFTELTNDHITQAIRFSDLAAYNGESGEVIFSDDQ
ncbi:hypothetical protein ABE493_00755 [Stenotrophomonas terrae]|uniref:hypothetical protein n=1 Tax=Stenotrophomonas terrae TaxID=405446 RepID=UPI003208B5D2